MLAAMYQAAPMLGCLGAVIAMIQFFDNAHGINAYGAKELMMVRALAILATGLVGGLICYAAHRILSARIGELSEECSHLSHCLVRMLDELRGTKTMSVEKQSRSNAVWRLVGKVRPNLGQINRLMLYQTFTALSLVLFFMLMANHSSWGPPSMNTPRVVATVSVPDEIQHASIWITRDGTYRMNSGSGPLVLIQAEELNARLAANIDEQVWLLYADVETPYRLIEDTLDALRAARVKEVVFMYRETFSLASLIKIE
jgi:biopolymer transport protein ExbD